jgi:hypothetical protein
VAACDHGFRLLGWSCADALERGDGFSRAREEKRPQEAGDCGSGVVEVCRKGAETAPQAAYPSCKTYRFPR